MLPSNAGKGVTGRDPLAKRSPSILVTDSRSSQSRSSAPFAGHAASGSMANYHKSKQLQQQKSVRGGGVGSGSSAGNYGSGARGPSGNSLNSAPGARARKRPSGRFSNVSMDNILHNDSAVPSGRREQRGSTSSWDRFPVTEILHASNSYRKMINPLPSRTSKISQKLVLIPEDDTVNAENGTSTKGSGNPPLRKSRNIGPVLDRKRHSTRMTNLNEFDNESYRFNSGNLSRLTAYNIAEGFDLTMLHRFLQNTHEVHPRLYDDCLYVPYVLPLLPGKDGFRIKSNVSKKAVGGGTLIDKLIDTSERRDHHYEYYSGVETLEDANNNYELEATGGHTNEMSDVSVIPDHLPQPTAGINPDAFDPREPQFFAEETPVEQELRQREEMKSITSDEGTNKRSSRERNLERKVSEDSTDHAELFIFHYGVIVFWNFTEEQEKNLLGDITFADDKDLMIRPIDEQDIETEEFHFEYDMDTERPRIFNDIVTLRSGDHIVKMTLSYAIAQSSKLSRFESRITPLLSAVMKLPKRLALHGTLGLRREQLLKKSGKLFKLRVDVNLSSSILDTPDFFWSIEPSLHPLYIAMREYLEIDKRVQVVNDRCKVFLEFFDICVDSVAERNMARVTWWFVVVIIIGVLFSLTEITIRYNIIHGRR
ncbi:Rmd8p KNAG_0D02960 [Huiozyma naganishii CBS 8797]|uniref:DUF155 domain-containing protein n=1 Tax=Huiozyma naganishii (strain ATCC MYA-139 / BCRC 22969 / CBS 8797 / KCTC 17520 / NBRC 10181 / NCYC 3082 / Yp74L-3) TaxID=1071383 RepID=J7R5D1_HUIN7|nr:hypothetical protein KNAG_0D02960 [Kazachstania naganishii CBS 8797]CCK70045.1 hypothetical protein KNAG_0D02960 [Kazachstania naganishii CBS 8797]